MTLEITLPESLELKPRIIVMGVGGAGVNAVDGMINANVEGVEFWGANTDAQALKRAVVSNKIQLGIAITKGLGAGSDPEVGKAAAEESAQQIKDVLTGCDMLFITAGMGGGTGTGAAPVVAQIAQDLGVLTVAVVTKPFHFEGGRRMKVAEAGVRELEVCVDTIMVIPNQNLFRFTNKNTTFAEACSKTDEVLRAGVVGITDLIVVPGLINLDFADIRMIMKGMGPAMMGTGEAEGEDRAINASEIAISNPILDNISMQGAKSVLVHIAGSNDITLFEIGTVVDTIKNKINNQDVNIIFGSTFNENLAGKIKVSVVATGVNSIDYVSHGVNSVNNITGAVDNIVEVEKEQMLSEKVDGHYVQNGKIMKDDVAVNEKRDNYFYDPRKNQYGRDVQHQGVVADKLELVSESWSNGKNTRYDDLTHSGRENIFKQREHHNATRTLFGDASARGAQLGEQQLSHGNKTNIGGERDVNVADKRDNSDFSSDSFLMQKGFFIPPKALEPEEDYDELGGECYKASVNTESGLYDTPDHRPGIAQKEERVSGRDKGDVYGSTHRYVHAIDDNMVGRITSKRNAYIQEEKKDDEVYDTASDNKGLFSKMFGTLRKG